MIFQPPFSQYAPWLKLLLFLIVVLVSALFVTLFGMLVATPFFGADYLENAGNMSDLANPASIARLKYLQIISQIGMFIVPVIAFAFMVTKQKAQYFSMDRRIPWTSTLAAMAVILLALPFINWLNEINQQMQFPASMSVIEQ